MDRTIVVSGGLVADGTGAPLREADIAVQAGRIVAIDKNLSGDEVIDARGAVVAPGFIDLHTHYDAQVLWDPACTPSSWQGVSTVVIGNCGFGLAPCRPENRAQLIQMLVDLEDMPAKVLEAGIDWSFRDFPGYLDQLEALKPSLNVAAYLGHSPVRIDVMGADAYERAATDQEVAKMAAIVSDAMAAGAVGFASTSGPSGRRCATSAATEGELIALGQAMGGRGLMALVPGGKSLTRERMYEIQPQIGRPITWTAMMAMPDNSHRDWIDIHRSQSARGPGRNVHPQVSGRPQVAMTTLKTAFALRTATMLELERQPLEARLAAYRNPEWRRLTAQQLLTLQTRVTWDRWTITESASHPELNGLTVVEAAERQGKDPLDFAFDLALEDGLETRFTVVQFNYDPDEVKQLLNLDGAVLGLADSGAHPDQICDAVLPTHLLGTWVRERKGLSLEKAVRKLTGEPAELLGLDRGKLQVSAPADITVFDPDTVAPGPIRRVRDFPAGGERLIADKPEGMRHMLVNGEPIRRDGESLSRPAAGGPGKVLRGG